MMRSIVCTGVVESMYMAHSRPISVGFEKTLWIYMIFCLMNVVYRHGATGNIAMYATEKRERKTWNLESLVLVLPLSANVKRWCQLKEEIDYNGKQDITIGQRRWCDKFQKVR
jgi:hypothetical protein